MSDIGVKPVLEFSSRGITPRLDIDAAPLCDFFGECVSQTGSFLWRHKVSTTLIGLSLVGFFLWKICSKSAPVEEPKEPLYANMQDWVQGASSEIRFNKHGYRKRPDGDGREKVRKQLASHQENIHNRHPFFIGSFPPEIEKHTDVTKIQFTRDLIKVIPAGIGQLANLAELNLADNRISELPVEIASLQNLRKLDLSDNQLRSLPAVLAHLINLKELKLSGNPFKGTFPNEILDAKWEHLEELEMNEWRKLPNELVKQIQAKASEGSKFARLFCEANSLPFNETPS